VEILDLAVIMYINYLVFLKNMSTKLKYRKKLLCLHFAFDAMCKHKPGKWIKLDFQT
jgi:hypothetical protein